MQRFSIQTLKNTPAVDVILSFTGEYRWLSNFEPCDIILEDNSYNFVYPSTENAYMAWKVPDLGLRKFLQTLTPAEAKKLSQTPEFIREHRVGYCNNSRIQAMLRLNRQKYSRKHSALRTKLLATDGATLVEGTTWDDTFFGFCLKTGIGHNYLGRLLMVVRDEVRVEEGFKPIYPKRGLLPLAVM